MDLIRSICVIVLCCISTGYALTIRQIIEQRQELIVLKGYMNRLSTLEQLGQTGRKFTFFAANNAAFDLVPSTVRTKYGSGVVIAETVRKEINDIIRYHMVYDMEGSTYSVADLGNKVLPTAAGDAAPIFCKTMGGKQYVNGAQIVEGDIQASNGVIHIIDYFLYQPAEPYNALTYLMRQGQQSENTISSRKFYQLLQEYESKVAPGSTGFDAREVLNSGPRVTLFIPNDATFMNMNIAKIIADFTLLKQVVESHIIATDVYHERLLKVMADQEIGALSGRVIPKRFGKDLYVSNFCASGIVRKANITVENGVVYIIEGVMGHVYNGLFAKMREISGIADFYTNCASSEPITQRVQYLQIGTEVPESKQLTVFAPINTAMEGQDLQKDGEYLEKALSLHIIEGKLAVSDMTNGTVRKTIREGYDAKFIRIEKDGNIDIYVEVNYVMGRIVRGDICTLNGMLHTVDHIIGTPTQNIYEYISKMRHLSDLHKTVSDTALATILGSTARRITMFLPTNEAFVTMRSGDLGRKLLAREHLSNLKKVLNRHIIETDVIIAELNMGKHVLNTKFDSVTLEKTATGVTINFGLYAIRVLPYDMRMTNGMVHQIDHVLYDEGNPNAGEWLSRASGTTPLNFLALTLVSIVTVFVCRYHSSRTILML